MIVKKKTRGPRFALPAAVLLLCAPLAWAQDGPIATAPIPPASSAAPVPLAPNATARPVNVPPTAPSSSQANPAARGSNTPASSAAASSADPTTARPKRQVAAPPLPPKKPQPLAAPARDTAKLDRSRQERPRYAVREARPAPWAPYQEWADMPPPPSPQMVPQRYYAEQALRPGSYGPSWDEDDGPAEAPFERGRMPSPPPW